MDHTSRIRDLSLCLNNRDDIAIYATVKKLEAGEPAYWFRGRTSGATWVVELSNCEDHNKSFLKALEVFVDRKPSVNVVEDILDNVIPLNDAAVTELHLCYRLQSTFRDEADLIDRERQAIFDPVFFPRMSDEMRDRWQRLYEGCQQRWANRREAEYEARIGKTAALAIALSNVSLDDAARAAVEGVQMGEVA